MLRLSSGLFDVDGDDDNESVKEEVEQVDNVADAVWVTLKVIIPEAEVLAHADNREDTEADDESNALPVE